VRSDFSMHARPTPVQFDVLRAQATHAVPCAGEKGRGMKSTWEGAGRRAGCGRRVSLAEGAEGGAHARRAEPGRHARRGRDAEGVGKGGGRGMHARRGGTWNAREKGAGRDDAERALY
jgi:hypothetical protein